MSTQAMLEELFVFGMRTRMGVPRLRLDAFAPPGLSLEEVNKLEVLTPLAHVFSRKMLDPHALDLFTKSGFMVLDHQPVSFDDRKRFVPKELWPDMGQGGLRPTEAGLARMDSILPRLLAIPD